MRKKLRLRDILPRWCGEGKSPRQDCSEKAPGEQGTQPGCLLLRSNTGRDRIHHFLILSGSYLRLTQDDDLTDLTERVLRDWTLPRGRNQSIYFTSEERVWQEAFKLDFSPYSSWISVPCAVNNLFNGTLQPSSLAWTTPDTLKGHGEGPTLSEAELLGTGAYASQALEIAPASGPQLPTLENIMKTSEKEGPALRLLSVATHPGQTGRRGPGSALPSLHSIQGGALDLWPGEGQRSFIQHDV
ncbi:uncharacterized protein LOC102151918 isoform X10 [Canis lupus familiaris]|uniref:uncharacterized protein LOC102151918 isoform X10 n=1 Tax=Canis lupus familiaris TaxID=9615 RepID=UPI0015F177B9|nr:uncharacterized protein LOC102151918 isoform X10 [Canis lupus familiaris]XP_038534560.1 uncharacterized protein LOC102151918 isoform X10 [Canis lupus familiaris]